MHNKYANFVLARSNMHFLNSFYVNKGRNKSQGIGDDTGKLGELKPCKTKHAQA